MTLSLELNKLNDLVEISKQKFETQNNKQMRQQIEDRYIKENLMIETTPMYTAKTHKGENEFFKEKGKILKLILTYIFLENEEVKEDNEHNDYSLIEKLQMSNKKADVNKTDLPQSDLDKDKSGNLLSYKYYLEYPIDMSKLELEDISEPISHEFNIEGKKSF